MIQGACAPTTQERNLKIYTICVCTEIRVYQQTPYNLVVVEPLATFLEELPVCEANDLYALSIEREPRDSDFSEVL